MRQTLLGSSSDKVTFESASKYISYLGLEWNSKNYADEDSHKLSYISEGYITSLNEFLLYNNIGANIISDLYYYVEFLPDMKSSETYVNLYYKWPNAVNSDILRFDYLGYYYDRTIFSLSDKNNIIKII